jgi:hypothetical protein
MLVAVSNATGEILGDRGPQAHRRWLDLRLLQSRFTREGWRRTVDAYRGDGGRYIVQSDELLTAFLELERTLL